MNTGHNEYSFYSHELIKLKEKDLYRQLHSQNPGLLNLSSNDYLGISGSTGLKKEFFNETDLETNHEKLMGSTSSRLLTGNHRYYTDLENEISQSYSKGAALVFNSGYHANTGIIPALTGKRDVIFSDKLNHASIIDGMKLSGADFFRFKHKDYADLEKLLRKHRHNYRNALVISETVFSMDGDCADIKKLIELKLNFDSLLYLDEAHASGVIGESGLGLADQAGLTGEIDILLGTFGKALSSIGAYAVCSPVLKEYLVNKSRTLIFTTGLPPITTAWNLFIFKKMKSMKEQRTKLKNLSNRLRAEIVKSGLKTAGNTQIVPVIFGSISETVSKAELLKDEGILVFPIRPPTVPPGTARLRLSLTANLSWDQIKYIPRLLSGGSI